MPTKEARKKTVKKQVIKTWEEELRTEARKKSTLEYLNVDICKFGEVHYIWKCNEQDTTNPLVTYRACTHVKLLTQRYPLHTNHAAGKKYGTKCPLCLAVEESMVHFLVECPSLHDARSTHLSKFKKALTQNDIEVSSLNIMQAILDPSKLSLSESQINELTSLGRNICFKLHLERSTIIQGSYKAPYHCSTYLKKSRNCINTH